MVARIGINGFGRIGRQVLRATIERHPDVLQVVAVNDLGDTSTNAHLFKYDSNYGTYPGEIDFQENQIINEDETVHTSGDGGYFNSGIPVGMTKIQDDKIYVIPTNNLEELQYLQIFLNNFKSF